MMEIKKVYLYSPGGMHSLYRTFKKNPPEGYEIISSEIKAQSLANKFFSRFKFFKNIVRSIVYGLKDPIIAEANSFEKEKLPQDVNLIFSSGRIVKRKDIPHVIEIVDKVTALAGNDISLFKKDKEFIKEALESKQCKKIICWTLASKKDFIEEFKSPFINKKLEVVYLTKPLFPKKLERKNHMGINLLFVGSINNPDDFLIKGGLETLETFKLLKPKYPSLNLYVRCKLPNDLKKKYSGLEGLHLIENFLSEEELNNLYVEADIFMTPSHNLNAIAPIEAMYYGLPLVGIDTWAVGEVIINNSNGFLIKKSDKIPYEENKIHLDVRNKDFLKQIREIDEDLIKRIAKKTEELILNSKLRLKLGNYGRMMVEKGKFSFNVRQKKLKNIMDKSLRN